MLWRKPGVRRIWNCDRAGIGPHSVIQLVRYHQGQIEKAEPQTFPVGIESKGSLAFPRNPSHCPLKFSTFDWSAKEEGT